MTKSVWDDTDDQVQKVSAIIEKIKAGIAAWQKPWKPGELLKPLDFDLRFYQARARRPLSVKDPERTDG